MTQKHHLKLIGTAASRVMRNVWMLDELKATHGVAYEHDPISHTDPALSQPPYSDFNPNARIPCLVVDGEAVFESLAINLYLADLYPGDLSPATALERARTAQWALWALTEVEQPVFDVALNTYLLPEAERKPEVAATGVAKLKRPLDALNAHLSKQPFLIADRFTVADLNTACVMYRALKMDLAAWPAVQAWMHTCWSREAAKPARRARGEVI